MNSFPQITLNTRWENTLEICYLIELDGLTLGRTCTLVHGSLVRGLILYMMTWTSNIFTASYVCKPLGGWHTMQYASRVPILTCISHQNLKSLLENPKSFLFERVPQKLSKRILAWRVFQKLSERSLHEVKRSLHEDFSKKPIFWAKMIMHIFDK